MNDLEQSGIDAPAFRLRNGSLGLSLRFSPEALTALTAEIGAGFMSIPRRGAEVGGILAGQMTQEGTEWLVTVEKITPVPVQYQYGPSYRLSAADKQEFQQLVNSGRQSRQLIGWYRSNTRPEHEIDEADRQISQTFFSAQSIFLFCKPSADGQIQAICIIMLPRRVEVAFAFALGKFSRIEALFHSRPDVDDALAPALPPSSSPASRALARTAPVPCARQPARVSSNAKIGAAAALAMIGALWYTRGHVFTPTTAQAGFTAASTAPVPAVGSLLGLRADYQKDSLLIGWDRTAPEIASAASATFRIADGSRARSLDLSARELQNGSIVYKPNTDEISIELNVTSRAGVTASQSIRIVGAALDAHSPANPAARPAIQETRVTASPRSFQPPPDTSPTQQREIATPDVPPISAIPAADANRKELVASNVPSLAEMLPKFTQTRSEFRPAEPLRSPQPVLPAGIRIPDYAYDRPLQIQVEVTIAPDGRVTAARLIAESGSYAGLLGPSAQATARLWKFRPATLGGQPIQSTMVLTFRYTRPR